MDLSVRMYLAFSQTLKSLVIASHIEWMGKERNNFPDGMRGYILRGNNDILTTQVMNKWKTRHQGQTLTSVSCLSQKNKQSNFTCVLTFLWLQIQKESLHLWGLLATHWRCGYHPEKLHSLLEPPQDSRCETVQPWNQIRWQVVSPVLLSLLPLQ